MSLTFSRRASIAIRALALALPVVGTFAATSANAGPLIVGTSYSETMVKLCAVGTKKCTVDGFTPVPAGKVLRVTRMNCGFVIPKSGQITSLYAARMLSNLTTMTNYNYFASPVKMSSNDEVTRYQVNEEMLLPLTATTRPAVHLTLAQNANEFNIGCTVTGIYENA